MDITSKPNLKPFRQYSEYEVINLYAHELGTVNKGTIVTVSSAAGNTNLYQNAPATAAPYINAGDSIHSSTPSRVTSLRPVVSWKVKTADLGDGDVPLGMLLYDVAETNQYGEKTIFRPRYEKREREVVASGEAVPILCRGIVKTNNFSGTPGPNSGGVLGSGDNAGVLVVSAETTGKCGKFLSTADADGYALFKLEL